jgi:type I restriction enzyme, S subunit
VTPPGGESAFDTLLEAGELPEGWVEAPLGDLAVHVLGGEWGAGEPDPERVPVRVLRGIEFRAWERDKGSGAERRWIKPVSLAKRRLRPGDLVVEVSGGGLTQPVGRTLLVDGEAIGRAGYPLICSNFCRQVRIHPEVSPAWVHLALTHELLRGGLDRFQTQTTNLRNLRFRELLAGAVLRLPPRDEQERIVARLAELLPRIRRAVEWLERIPEILRRMRQSLLAAACEGRLTERWRERAPAVDVAAVAERVREIRQKEILAESRRGRRRGRRPPKERPGLAGRAWQAPEPLEAPEVPEGWTVVALQDLLVDSQYGISKRAEADLTGGVPVLRMGNIQDGRLDLADLKYLDPIEHDLEPFLLQKEDILFNRTNSPELVGKAAVFESEMEAVFASYLVRLVVDRRLVLPGYLCLWINSPWGRAWARRVRTDCVSQSNINVSKLRTLPVPLPSLTEQGEIVRRVADLLAFTDGVEESAAAARERARLLDRAVLARAVNGELVPPEAELARIEGRAYEPAADLVARVRSERRPGGEVPGAGRPGGPAGHGPEIFAPERVMAAFRQACWGAGVLPEAELLRRVAGRLGSRRLGKHLRGRLRELLATAEARRILAREGDLWVGATPNFARYDTDFLAAAAVEAVRPGEELEPAALIRAVASHLGYSQVTAAIRARMETVLHAAVRRGLLAARGGRLRRAG